MFKFRKREVLFDMSVEEYVAKNSSVYYLWEGGNYEDKWELKYNPTTGRYEIFELMPVCDDRGNITNTQARHEFQPLYCMTHADIYTLEDLQRLDFYRLKKEALKNLINKIESL